MDKVESSGDVGIDDVPNGVEGLVEKGAPKPGAGIGQESLNGPAPDRAEQFVDTLLGRQIAIDGIDPGALFAELASRLMNAFLIGGDDDVEAMRDALLGKFITDTARSAGNHCHGTHGH